MTSLETEAPSSSSFHVEPYEYVVPSERIGGYFAAVRRQWWVVLLVFVVAVGAALAVSGMRTKQYNSTSKVLLAPAEPDDILQQTTNGTHSLDPAADQNTAVQLVSLQTVARQVRDQLGLREASTELLKHVTVAAVGNSSVIGITAQNPSPAEAKKIADAFARQYVNVRRSTASALYLKAANAGGAQLASLPPDARSATEGKTLAALTSQLRVAAALRTGAAQVLDYAAEPSSPAAPNTKMNVIAAAVLGLFVGFLAALGLDRFRSSRPERAAAQPRESSPTRVAAS